MRTQAHADVAARALLGIDVGDRGFDLDGVVVDQAQHPGRRGARLGDGVGDVLGILTAAGDEDAVGDGRDRLELGVALEVEAVGAAAEAEDLRDLFGVVGRREPGREDHHIGGDAPDDAQQRVFGLDHQAPLFVGRKGDVGDLGGAAADEVDALVHEPPVELFVVLAEAAHVDVELVYLGLGQVLLDQVRELERVHAAHARAELLIVLVATAHAVQDDDRLGRLAVLADDLATGRARGVGDALELEAGDHVVEAAVPVARLLSGVPQLEAGSHDDGADVELDDLVFLLEVDGPRAAGRHAGLLLALALGQREALGGIDRGAQRHRLREGDVDGAAKAEALVELAFDLAHHAGFLAGAAARTDVGVDVARLLADLDREVADVALDVFDLGVGHEGDVGVFAQGRHLGSQDAGGAVERGEGLVEHGHMAADRGVALDQRDVLAGGRQLESRLDAGDAAAHDQNVVVDRHLDGLERLVERQPMDLGAEDALGLGGGGHRVDGHPRTVLADVGHLQQIRIEAAVRGRLAESGFVHGRRAGRHDRARDAELLDVVLDEILARIGAHVLVLARHGHVGLRGGPLGDLFDVDLATDVGAAVTDVDADLFFSHRHLLLAAHAGIAASTSSHETSCKSMASFLGSTPNARPASWVKYMTGILKLVPNVELTRGW